MVSLMTVKAGSCMNNGDGRICALQATDCPSGTSFVTPSMLKQGGWGLAHGGVCATRVGTEDTSKIGSCSEGCASDATACLDPSSFVAIDDRCTIRNDNLKAVDQETLFGYCESDNTCYWSQADCTDPSSWARAHAGNGCNCEHVRVGACVYQGYYFCAVSKFACSSVAEWIDAPTLAIRSDAPDCFLCQPAESSPVPVAPGEATPSKQPTQQGTSRTNDPLNPTLREPSVKKNGDSSKGKIVGLSVGGFALVCFFLSAVVYAKRRISSRGPRPTNKTVSEIPLETATASAVNIDNSEDLSDVED